MGISRGHAGAVPSPALSPRLTALALAGLLAACAPAGSGTGVGSIEPREGRSGLALSGTLGGRQVAVSDGAPRLRTADCDVNDGLDEDVCFFSRDLDGGFFAVVVENPAALRAGGSLPVMAACPARGCDAVTDGVVVDIQAGADQPRERATEGSVSLTAVEPEERYAGRMTLALPGGRLSGTFDVVPRPEPE